MKKYTDLLWHALLVGGIAALVVLACGFGGFKTWIAFFAWANHFLHGCHVRKSMKMLLAFGVGIIIAFTAAQLIAVLSADTGATTSLFISAGIVLVAATLLIYLECIEHWENYVPATFLGTVLFFASGATANDMILMLLPPLLIGIIAGLLTISGRAYLAKLLRQ